MRSRLPAWIAVSVVAFLAVTTPAAAFFVQSVDGPISPTNGIVIGPDGNFWVVEQFSNSVVHMTAAGTVLARVPVGGEPISIANGPSGTVWVTVPALKRLVRINTLVSPPAATNVNTGTPCGPVAVTGAPDGFVYFSVPAGSAPDAGCAAAASLLGRASGDGLSVTTNVAGGGKAFDLEVAGGKLYAPDFDGGVVRRVALGSFAVETTVAAPTPGGAPDGITSDGAGNIWFTEFNAGKVARFPQTQNGGAAISITPVGGAVSQAFGIVAGADGHIYVTGKASANIMRVSPEGAFAFYPLGNFEPWQIINGTDGDLWFTDQAATRIVRFVNSAPRAATGAAAATAPTTAAATATVNPRGNETTVVFDYGPTTAYGATSQPVTVPNGASPVAVTGVLSGLRPGTTYHLRARATNAEGSATGVDATFATPVGDADGDGVSVPADCDDANPAIRPGAVDKPGDKIDQDCSGKDAAYPELTATTNFTYIFRRTYTIVTSVVISRLRGGETATIRCTGRRCPFTSKRFKLKKGKRTFGRKLLRQRRLPVGTKLSVRVTKRATIGTSTVLTVRRGKAPRISRACLRPGATKPSKCP